MIKKSLLLILTATVAIATASAAPITWKADAAHTSVGFKIRHFFSKVPGSFAQVDATLTFDPENPAANSVVATIPTATINTANERRDAHLKSADFFEVEKFPTMTFKSTRWTKNADGTYDVLGDLTIKGVTKPVTLKTKFLGSGPGARDRQVGGWEATTTFNRHDFGVSYSNPALGDEVEVQIEFEANPA